MATMDYAGDTIRYTDLGDAFVRKQTLQNATIGWCSRHGRIVAASKKTAWTYQDPYRVGHSGFGCKVSVVPQEILKAVFPEYRVMCENIQNLANDIGRRAVLKETSDVIKESGKLTKIQEEYQGTTYSPCQKRRKELDD
jgi:hypothetical protein